MGGDIEMETEETKDVETTEEEVTEEEQQEETYTRSDVDREISKAVENALQRKSEEFEAKKQKEIEEAKAEAAEYAKLTQKEKEEADYQKRIEELEAREKELNNRELLSNIQSDLKEQDLPTELASMLIHTGDNKEIREQIKAVKELIEGKVNAQVKETLRQDEPQVSGEAMSSDPFKERLKKYK